MAQCIIGPKFYGIDSDGNPLAFGKLYTYETGTTTPKVTFKGEGAAVPNTNPVILNGEGYADIYLDGSYSMILKDADDVEQWSEDPVTSPLEASQLPIATELIQGIIAIATAAEMTTGTNDTKAATAKKIKDLLGAAAYLAVGTSNGQLVLKENILALVPDASETVKGIVERATQAEADAGTDDERFLTPKKLNDSAFTRIWISPVTSISGSSTVNITNTPGVVDASVTIQARENDTFEWGSAALVAETTNFGIGYSISPTTIKLRSNSAIQWLADLIGSGNASYTSGEVRVILTY